MIYLLLKSLHVSAAIIWIGSIIFNSTLNLLMIRKKDIHGIIALSNQEAFFSKYLILPSGIVLLVAGIAMSTFVGFGWPFWVIWGFVVIILTGILGSVVIHKINRNIIDIVKSDKIDYPQLKILQNKLRIWNVITIVLLFSAVWVMIFKPTI